MKKFDKLLVVIITCWILLLIALVMKLFGSKLFNIIIENKTFIDICNWLDGSWTKYIVSTIFYIISNYLIYLSMTDKKIGQDWWILIVMLPFSYIKAQLNWIGLFLDFLILLIIPLIRTKGKNWLKIIIGILLVMAFQEISLLIRDLHFYLNSDSILVALILSIDYYIMIILYYLYSRMLIRKKLAKIETSKIEGKEVTV